MCIRTPSAMILPSQATQTLRLLGNLERIKKLDLTLVHHRARPLEVRLTPKLCHHCRFLIPLLFKADGIEQSWTGCLSPEVFEETSTNTESTRATSNMDVVFSYYPFLELNIPSHVPSQDVNFLELQQCFRIPARPILDAFVREYFSHVHPNLPIIDEGVFWDMYNCPDFYPSESPRISLFVFQAMIFAASAVSPSALYPTNGSIF
jgi:hypothetical protein